MLVRLGNSWLPKKDFKSEAFIPSGIFSKGTDGIVIALKFM